MKIVDSKTGGEKATIVNGEVVKMVHTTYHKATDAHFELTTSFDFTGVSIEERTRLAAECLLIRWRTAFKGSEKVDASQDNVTVKVSEMLSKGRRKLSKAEKVRKLDLSKEDLLALLAEKE